MKLTHVLAAATGLAVAAATASPRATDATAVVVMPGVASTREATEIRMAFSPDGRRRLWGRIDRGTRGFEIYESVRSGSGWSPARPVPFDTAYNDFDPSFAPDGRSVLFFSNRPGGLGGDDIWSVPFDPVTGRYGEPRNLGAPVNTAGDEWAPSLSRDGRKLLFSSNGHGGYGGQDLFVAEATTGGWSVPANLGPGVNGKADDFDATFFGERGLVFTSGNAAKGPIFLYRADRVRNAFTGRERLPPPFNCSDDINLGPAWNSREPDKLYFSAACPKIGVGKADIFAARMRG